jgi:aspartyl-tRNA(Asn)/glutamyl-tRNA(Gln) amidotransferase subunit B
VAALNKAGLDITESPVSWQRLAQLLMRIADNTISGKIGKQVFEALWLDEDNQSADDIIASKGLKQITDSGAIETIIDKIIADNPGQVEQYRSGKDKVFAFFVGQVMKSGRGKQNVGGKTKISGLQADLLYFLQLSSFNLEKAFNHEEHEEKSENYR